MYQTLSYFDKEELDKYLAEGYKKEHPFEKDRVKELQNIAVEAMYITDKERKQINAGNQDVIKEVRERLESAGLDKDFITAVTTPESEFDSLKGSAQDRYAKALKNAAIVGREEAITNLGARMAARGYSPQDVVSALETASTSREGIASLANRLGANTWEESLTHTYGIDLAKQLLIWLTVQVLNT